MPRLSAYFVRAALVYLLLGFTLGGLMLANKGVPFWPGAWSLLAAHMEFTFVGWMVQLALGVAFWILPRFSGGAPRGNERPSWLAFVALNAGIWISVLQPVLGGSEMLFVGRVFEFAGLAFFVLGNWKRVKPLGG